MKAKMRPRFPNRKRRLQRAMPALLGLCLVGFVAGFLTWALWNDSPASAPAPAAPPAEQVAVPPAPRPAPAPTNSAGRAATPPRQTDPPAQRSAAPAPSSTPTASTPISSSPSPASPPSSTQTQPAQGTTPAPRQTPPADANGPSLWNLPFAGHSYKEIAAEMSRRYPGKPRLWAEKMPGITSRLEPAPTGPGPVVALTLDACSGAYDAGLIDFLRARQIPATLFVTGRWIKENPETFRDLAKDPLFEIADHGMRHRPCSVNGREAYGIKGTADMEELVDEVEGGAREIHRNGGPRPHWFRSGTAFYDDIAVRVIADLGMGVAGYSIAVDEGATLPAHAVRDKTLKAKNGDILLGHMNHPTSGTRQGLMEALPKLQEKGYRFVRLSER